MRRDPRRRDPDAPLKMRRAAAPLLGLLAAAGLAGALAARLGPLPEGAEGRRAERLRRRAAEALEQDAARLSATSRRLAGDPALLEIVEGGSGGVRPGRLFSLLGSALPKESGWGVVLLDRTGGCRGVGGGARRPPGSLRAARGELLGHVPRHAGDPGPRVSRRPQSGDAGASRRDAPLSRPASSGPTFSRRHFLAGVPTVRRIRVRASTVPGRLVALSLEPAAPAVVEEDVRRDAALPWALLGALAALALGVVARAPATGVVAARLLLLLAVPCAETGPFAPILPRRLRAPVDTRRHGPDRFRRAPPPALGPGVGPRDRERRGVENGVESGGGSRGRRGRLRTRSSWGSPADVRPRRSSSGWACSRGRPRRRSPRRAWWPPRAPSWGWRRSWRRRRLGRAGRRSGWVPLGWRSRAGRSSPFRPKRRRPSSSSGASFSRRACRRGSRRSGRRTSSRGRSPSRSSWGPRPS